MSNHIEKFGQLIVPIFYGDKFWATGFFCNSYLITAKHIFFEQDETGSFRKEIDISEFTFIFNNTRCHFLEYLFEEYINPNKQIVNKYEDLVILLTDADISNEDELMLCASKEVDTGSIATYVGYDCGETNNKPNISSFAGIIQHRNLKLGGYLMIRYENTLLMTGEEVERAVNGMSGGPVFVNEEVIGMLITIPVSVPACRLISASHIADVISRIESNH